MQNSTFQGELVIDHNRGVIWFNSVGGCIFRICDLPNPIPKVRVTNDSVSEMLDVHYPGVLGAATTSWHFPCKRNPECIRVDGHQGCCRNKQGLL